MLQTRYRRLTKDSDVFATLELGMDAQRQLRELVFVVRREVTHAAPCQHVPA
jgi:hypothetical protein